MVINLLIKILPKYVLCKVGEKIKCHENFSPIEKERESKKNSLLAKK